MNEARRIAIALCSCAFGLVGCGTGEFHADEIGELSQGLTTPNSVTLLAGKLGGLGDNNGALVDARFGEMTKLSIDDHDHLFVLDKGNRAIRKINVATQQVTTVIAGIDATAIAVDHAGTNIYFFDSQPATGIIRKVTVASGAVVDVAGGAYGKDDGQGSQAQFQRRVTGMAVDPTDTFLYVADTYSHTIRQLELSTNNVYTFAGEAEFPGGDNGLASAARFRFPTDVAMDGNGDLYVSDVNGARKVITAGLPAATVSTVAPVVIDGAPAAIAVDNGTMMISDDYLYRIRTFSAGTWSPSWPDGGLSYGMVAKNGIAYFTRDSWETLTAHNLSTGASTLLVAGSSPGDANGTALNARFWSPMGLATDNQGSAYVADSVNGAVRRVSLATGATSLLAGGLSAPTAVTSDSAGHLYVTESGNGNVTRIEIATGQKTLVKTFTGTNNFLTGITYLGGALYVVDTNACTVRKIDLATGTSWLFAGAVGSHGFTNAKGTSARFDMPIGITSDGNRYLYVADHDNAALRKIDTAAGANSANVTTLPGTFAGPTQLAVSGNFLYVTEASNHTVAKLNFTTGTRSVFAGRPDRQGVVVGTRPAKLNTPWGIAAITGGVVVTDRAENAVLQIFQ